VSYDLWVVSSKESLIVQALDIGFPKFTNLRNEDGPSKHQICFQEYQE
jgi:hypothetical protein